MLPNNISYDKNVKSLFVKYGSTNTRIALSKLMYAEIFNRKIVLHMNDSTSIEYYGRMTDLENYIENDGFFRLHRSYLVSLCYVQSYDSRAVHLPNADIPIARGKYQEFKDMYRAYNNEIKSKED